MQFARIDDGVGQGGGGGADFREVSATWEIPVEPGALATTAQRSLARLVLVFECRSREQVGCRVMLDELDQVTVGRNTAVRGSRVARSGRSAVIWVRDNEASRQHLIVRRRPGGWQVEDQGSRNGTVVNGVQVRTQLLVDGDVIEVGGAMLMFLEGGARPVEQLDRDVGGGDAEGLEAFQTLSLELDARIQQAKKIAPSMVPVLVRGETGTGKELMARAIHVASGRSGAFVAVNCGALPRDLVESELFGYKKGAFSGATDDREGLIRRAHKGTLFLDEIAELPPDSQAALLRVLQEGEVRPVGASEAIKVDVRIVVATHQDLEQRITSGLFRQDLYGRIAGFEVRMPPLRDRREDIGMLIEAIIQRSCPQPDAVSFHKSAARALLRYPWPLNIRELEQSITAAVALSETGQIRIDELPAVVRGHESSPRSQFSERDRALRERLIELLRESGGNIAAVGRAMDRAPIQIRRWCTRLSIDLALFR